MKQKILATLVVLVASLGMLFATGAKEQQEKGTVSSKAKQITFTVINGGDTEIEAFNKIIAKFEEINPNIKVRLEALPNSTDYENIIKTRFATNDPPDAFWFWSGANQYTNMRASENLVDMTGERGLSDLTSAIKTYQTVDGKIYGIPWGTYNAMGIYYNKKVFAKLGLTPPKNYHELLDIAQTIKDAGIIPFYEAGDTVWPTQIYTLCAFQSSIIPSIGGASGLKKIVENQIQLKDIPAVKDTFSKYYALKTKGYLNEDVGSATYDMQEEAISSGKAAMVFQADWMLPDIQSKFGNADDLGYFPLPSETDEGVASLYPPKQIFVSKASKNVDAVLTFVRFMIQTDNLDIWYGLNSGIPVYKSVTSTLYTAQKDIMNYLTSDKGMVQIQLQTKASFPDFDKICQMVILSGNVDQAVTMLNDGYLKDGRNKQISEFL
ncbi:ABC transporter substrate-binding protein [uncultured Sphaerochaeta sp.]|uniref:ABC transporter substrate-binding protein n=1 Tax=uncultured Sphaerochaeta sp. TaxID=886478 RepID=UPI002A0A500B|nr:ABC transporter substrate-binding protein [uncultured Sphaerochaeta sp.]